MAEGSSSAPRAWAPRDDDGGAGSGNQHHAAPVEDALHEAQERQNQGVATTVREFITCVKRLGGVGMGGYGARGAWQNPSTREQLDRVYPWLRGELERRNGPLDLCTASDVDVVVAAAADMSAVLDAERTAELYLALARRINGNYVARLPLVCLGDLLKIQRVCCDPRVLAMIVDRVKRHPLDVFSTAAVDRGGFERGALEELMHALTAGGDAAVLSAADVEGIVRTLRAAMGSACVATRHGGVFAHALFTLARGCPGDVGFLHALEGALIADAGGRGEGEGASCRAPLAAHHDTNGVYAVLMALAGTAKRHAHCHALLAQAGGRGPHARLSETRAFLERVVRRVVAPAGTDSQDNGWRLHRMLGVLRAARQLHVYSRDIRESAQAAIYERARGGPAGGDADAAAAADAARLRLGHLELVCEEYLPEHPDRCRAVVHALYPMCASGAADLHVLAQFLSFVALRGVAPPRGALLAFNHAAGGLPVAMGPASADGDTALLLGRCALVVLRFAECAMHRKRVLDAAVRACVAPVLPHALLAGLVRHLPLPPASAEDAAFVSYLRAAARPPAAKSA